MCTSLAHIPTHLPFPHVAGVIAPGDSCLGFLGAHRVKGTIAEAVKDAARVPGKETSVFVATERGPRDPLELASRWQGRCADGCEHLRHRSNDR